MINAKEAFVKSQALNDLVERRVKWIESKILKATDNGEFACVCHFDEWEYKFGYPFKCSDRVVDIIVYNIRNLGYSASKWENAINVSWRYPN